MQTIGQILKTARTQKSYSLKKLEDITKIKADFIGSIEKENWENLPAFPTVLGFVKSISAAIDLDEIKVVAVLKRDYPPQKLRVSPKPDVESKFLWTPKLTFVLGIIAIFIIMFGYLFAQYKDFVSPPNLVVESPIDGQLVQLPSVLVFGVTETDAKVLINNQPVLIAADGKFSIDINISKDTKEIVVKSISRSGKETVVSRNIHIQE